jgi:hypothetical protein
MGCEVQSKSLQHGLYPACHIVSDLCGMVQKLRWIIDRGMFLRPKPKAIARKPAPIKPRSGIGFAPQGDIGMPDHMRPRKRPAVCDASQQAAQLLHLRMWKGMRTTIAQFDANRGGIHILASLPKRPACVPCAMCLIHQLRHVAMFIDHVMCRDLEFRGAQAINRCARAVHCGVMKNHVPRL